METYLKELYEKAKEASKQSYSPYSEFAVGAALLCGSGKVYTGCNVENASYPATICAERVALYKAVSEGERDFKALAVCGFDKKTGSFVKECPPCGVCRQALCEFCPEDLPVVISQERVVTIGELIPCGFIYAKGEQKN
ncbi:MAG: cytidine deaminase [Clostridiales bacterium]|nr:cytidine deaminase [Clostridiales bacterium]